MADESELSGETYCYLTTTGRVTGQPHTIEIWFALRGRTVYMLSGGGTASDWVRNLQRTPEVSVRIREQELAGRARVIEAGSSEDELARELLPEKYQPGYSSDLSEWRRTALGVAIDLD